MKPKIIAKSKVHLINLIAEEIDSNGWECDLNHINISYVEDLSLLFQYSKFNGDISNWNVSNVKNMNKMFSESKFNGDISKWDTSNVTSMFEMFTHSIFNKDISNWNVENVEEMQRMFYKSEFNQDLSNWKPYKAILNFMIYDCKAEIPYWFKSELEDDYSARQKTIDAYHLNKELNSELNQNSGLGKKLKL
jgi:surface protein